MMFGVLIQHLFQLRLVETIVELPFKLNCNCYDDKDLIIQNKVYLSFHILMHEIGIINQRFPLSRLNY